MKKLLLILFIGSFIYSCSEINEPSTPTDLQLSNNASTIQLNKSVGNTSRILADSVPCRTKSFTDSVMPPKRILLSNSVNPPKLIIRLIDSVNPPKVIMLCDSVNPPNP